MPRPRRARRFEPRYGVSREMLAIEAGYVAKEVEDYSLLSMNELREKEAELRKAWQIADRTVEAALPTLDDREQHVLRCLIIRDLYHLLELYRTVLNGDAPEVQEIPRKRPARTQQPAAERLPFSEWLFGDSRGLSDVR